MKRLLLPALALVLPACSPGIAYRLTPEMADSNLVLEGTVLATEKDGDFLLETDGLLALVDAEDLDHEVEMGDRVRVSGTVEHEPDDAEAPELDASRIEPWRP